MSENRENKSRTRSLEPEIFTNDESVEPFRWIRHYELYSKKEGWDESKQLELLELFLDGKALNWFEQKVDSFKTWKNAKEAFLSKFDSHETELRSWRELQMLKQNKEEDLEEFILKIEKLFERSSIRDSAIKFKCLLSSVLPKYQKLIIREKIKSYDEALTTSLEQEAVEKICRMDVIEKETESQGFNIQVNELKHTVKNSEDVSDLLRRFNEMRISLINLKKSGIIPETVNTEPIQNNLFSNEVERISNRNEELKRLGACYRCKQPGHLSRDCPLAPWNKKASSDNQVTEKKNSIQCLQIELKKHIYSKELENSPKQNLQYVNLLEESSFKEIEAAIEDCEMELGTKEYEKIYAILDVAEKRKLTSEEKEVAKKAIKSFQKCSKDEKNERKTTVNQEKSKPKNIQGLSNQSQSTTNEMIRESINQAVEKPKQRIRVKKDIEIKLTKNSPSYSI
ncbi:hypothetical protein BB560_005511 [Smittium megazygosporum]|uniref:CCHC-type domain-containing protein n=1 Tax=Smittium megazygosporum TaxID=133381 RepID=A0A2T9Z458_9FUNG|nr:hypothetical protein BB560_005511 [Smittium megazygosporum]